MLETAIIHPQPSDRSSVSAESGTEVQRIDWLANGLGLSFQHAPEQPLVLLGATSNLQAVEFPTPLPLVEVLAVGYGHTLANSRLVQTSIGAALRYVSHAVDAASSSIHFVLATPSGIQADLVISGGDKAFRSAVTITNRGSGLLLLTAVTSWATPLGTSESSKHVDVAGDWILIEGLTDWLGEGRWTEKPLRSELLPELSQNLTGHTPRSGVVRTAKGTWSTGAQLPVAGISSASRGLTWLWEIEHNGPWRWEVGEHEGDCYFALSGPTDRDHQWSQPLAAGESFTAVSAMIAFGHSLPDAAAALTSARRRVRRDHPDNMVPTIVFNDYMNTLNGNPTAEKLLPLVDAAAITGAETFCIDAGWYSDSSDWWDTVGEWTPSTTRFPNGFEEVIDAIRSKGMVPGLWLEPEVVGVNSPIANILPNEAFLQRAGIKVEEHGRYHLDLRHHAARAHLDGVIDHLVENYGIGFFKFDYNIDGGPGTDLHSPSVGAGLLEHNRAHLAWIESLLDRHPALVLENCSSGGMRTDAAMLARMQLQSTSDQQDPMRYPPIAASAGLSMLPEVAASWAYPQPELSAEQNAFTLVTGLSGRFYLSGFLNRMDERQLSLVSEAVEVARSLRPRLMRTTPSWPLGLPGWNDRWVASALHSDEDVVISIWDRGHGEDEVTLHVPALKGCDLTVATIFPRYLPAWETRWSADTGTLTVRSTVDDPSARTFILTPSAPPV